MEIEDEALIKLAELKARIDRIIQKPGLDEFSPSTLDRLERLILKWETVRKEALRRKYPLLFSDS